MERPDPVERPVLVFDFGSQFVQLIAGGPRAARFARSSATTCPWSGSRAEPLALILSGGPRASTSSGAPRCDPRIFDLEIPILGSATG